MRDYWNGKAAYNTKNLGNTIKINRLIDLSYLKKFLEEGDCVLEID